MHPPAEIRHALSLDTSTGLTAASVALSRSRFGSNALTPPPTEPAWRKFLVKFDEPIIRILLAAALLKLVVDLFDSHHGGSTAGGLSALGSVVLLIVLGTVIRPVRPWLPSLLFAAGGVLAAVATAATGVVPAEGLAVMAAVALATGVSFFAEYKSDREFDVLNAQTRQRLAKVIRDAAPQSVPLHDVVVGDVVILEAGDEIPADGRVLVANDLDIDQSLLTGESEPVRKQPCIDDVVENPEQSDVVFRGTQVSHGGGRMLVAAVGDATQLGQLAHSLADQDDDTAGRLRQRLHTTKEVTPLQQKLTRLADRISRLGYIAAVAIFIAFVGADVIRGRLVWPFVGGVLDTDLLVRGLDELLQAFVVMVVIIVVAVPEGLPMSVTVSLALAMRKMTRANSLVRRLVACETIGSATIICTDKTGTLTQNRMQVARIGWVGASIARTDDNAAMNLADAPAQPLRWIALNSAVNSTAYLEERDGKLIALGNSTEAALLDWLRDGGLDYAALRRTYPPRAQTPFSSERKRMSTTVEIDGRARDFFKGAAEILLAESTHYLNEDGQARPWTDSAREAIREDLRQAEGKAMRTLAFAQRDADTLVYVGHVGIRDPLRQDVPTAIAHCKSAGIAVMMITGDNPRTARAIAADAGLLDAESPLVLTSDEFNALGDDELIPQLGRLRVLARARPLDKLRLVKLLQSQHHVVAMTGDGTNDAPALKRADVGLSMGKSGTEVAKEASSIVLLDDSFATIVRAVHWGRALYENIQRFLQFQLTINVSALAIAFLGTLLLGTQPPFTVLQMLWINVIMDTFAAIALCSEPPRRGLLGEPPKRRDQDIISPDMYRNIGATAAFYVVVMLGLLIGMKSYGWFNGDDVSRLAPFTYRQATVFFTLYVFFQVFNQINCRSLHVVRSPFRGLWHNRAFVGITALTVLGQVVIVTIGGKVFNVRPLSAGDWLFVVAAASTVLPFAAILARVRRGGGHEKPR